MWIVLTVLGCAIKSGLTIMQAEKAYQVANTVENHKAVYEWTMAESYMLKAREEYADSSFEEAEKLAIKAIEWMDRATQTDKDTPKKEDW